jgi:hypothetical protein
VSAFIPTPLNGSASRAFSAASPSGSSSRLSAAPDSRHAVGLRESATLETVKQNMTAGVEADDLDVPAFIRKRGESS